MDGACSTRGTDERFIQNFIASGKRLFGEHTHKWKNDIKIILEGTDYVYVNYSFVHWQAVVNMSMNLGSHKKQEIARLTEQSLASQGELYYT
jgi:hypothetical protein